MIVEKLQNELTVVVQPVRNKIATIDVWIGAGSANEDSANNGVSHFLEHMLFKGTPKYGLGELDKTIMSIGGIWNAGTSKDFTHYYVTVAAPFFETALDAISDMIQHPLLDPEEFKKEQLVILEEYRRKQDNPYGVLYDELYGTSFARGPYRSTVLGSFESISGLSRETMAAYFRHYYSPSSIAVIAVGDLDTDTDLRKIESAFSHFGTAAEGPPAAVTPPEPTEYTAGLSRTIAMDVQETYLAMAWPAPAMKHTAEVLALDVLSTVLGEGRSSRLYRILKEEKRLVNVISAGFPTHRYESLFYVMATLDRDKTEAASGEIRQVLHDLCDRPPTTEEMNKAKRIIRNQFYFSTETNSGQSSTIGYYYTLTGSTEFLETYIENLDKVTAEELQSVARKYFMAEPDCVVVEPEKPSPGEP